MSYFISCGEYSYYKIVCTVASQELGEEICARLNLDTSDNYSSYRVEECPHVASIQDVHIDAVWRCYAEGQRKQGGKITGRHGSPLDRRTFTVRNDITFGDEPTLKLERGVEVDRMWWDGQLAQRFDDATKHFTVTGTHEEKEHALRMCSDAFNKFLAEQTGL